MSLMARKGKRVLAILLILTYQVLALYASFSYQQLVRLVYVVAVAGYYRVLSDIIRGNRKSLALGIERFNILLQCLGCCVRLSL